jgi:hypothetical protein
MKYILIYRDGSIRTLDNEPESTETYTTLLRVIIVNDYLRIEQWTGNSWVGV